MKTRQTHTCAMQQNQLWEGDSQLYMFTLEKKEICNETCHSARGLLLPQPEQTEMGRCFQWCAYMSKHDVFHGCMLEICAVNCTSIITLCGLP